MTASEPSNAPPPEAEPIVPPPTDDESAIPPSLFGDFALFVLTWLWRGAGIALGTSALIGLAASAALLLHRVPDVVAHIIEQQCLDIGIASAALAMCVGAVRAGAEERRRFIARERFRIAAERAHYEAYLARVAKREADREAAAREAIAAAERSKLAAAEREAMLARVAAAEPPPLTHDEIEALQERARAERERLEEELRIETAIRNGTRAA